MTHSPPSAKRPRRLTLRRVLLALMLGLGAWWGAGWWLSPRPLYTLRFVDAHSPNIPQANFFASFTVWYDDEGRLAVTRPSVPQRGQVTVDRFDLETGTPAGSEVYTVEQWYSRTDQPRGNSRLAHYVSINPHWQQNGMPHRYQEEKSALEEAPTLFRVPGSRESIRESPARPPPGGLLGRLLALLPWLDWSEAGVGVWDDVWSRFLWRTRTLTKGEGYVVFATQGIGKLVVVQGVPGGERKITVLAPPFVSWSPWWPRAAGLLVAVLVLLVRRT